MVKITVLKHSDSKKSAFCRVSRTLGPFTSEVGIGYLYVEKDAELPAIGAAFNYAGEVDFVTMVDDTTGEVRQTKEGVSLQRIVLK